jgi:hypothetical protein
MKKTFIIAALAGIALNAVAELDRVYWNGSSWVTSNINANAYQSLAQEAAQAGPILITHGSLADGSGTKQIRSGNWGDSWVENPINSIQYIELATRHNLANQFYGLRPGGQIDLVYFTGSSWAIYGSYTGPTLYKAITADYANNTFLYAVRADGTGVDRLTISGTSIVFNYYVGAFDFKEIETMTGVGNSFYGARADGNGLDRVYWTGSAFTSQSLVATDYKALAADAYWAGNGTGLMVYGARADGTGVDRIRSDNWGSSWFLDSAQLTTKDYDELATMTGVANQFYASTLPVAPRFTRLSRLEDGSVRLLGTGPTNAIYRVFAATNVAVPFIEWNELGSGTFTNGVLDFTDDQAMGLPRRFYRAVTP